MENKLQTLREFKQYLSYKDKFVIYDVSEKRNIYDGSYFVLSVPTLTDNQLNKVVLCVRPVGEGKMKIII